VISVSVLVWSFLFKQWGQWAPTGAWAPVPDAGGNSGDDDSPVLVTAREALVSQPTADGCREVVKRVGKHQAGRMLDGRTWDEYPST